METGRRLAALALLLAAPLAAGMDRAERRGGQRGEHARMGADRLGDALAAVGVFGPRAERLRQIADFIVHRRR